MHYCVGSHCVTTVCTSALASHGVTSVCTNALASHGVTCDYTSALTSQCVTIYSVASGYFCIGICIYRACVSIYRAE